MKTMIVLSLIVVFMVIGYVFNKWFQRIIKPRDSFGRLFFYFFSVLALVFVLSFLMVLLVGRLYPDELIK